MNPTTFTAAGAATQTVSTTNEVMTQFMNLLKATKEGAATNKNEHTTQQDEDKEEDNPAIKLNISDSAFARLLTMCGITQSCADELPEIWIQLAEKKATNSDKEATVRAALNNEVKWKEAKVHPLSSIVTMIIKRSFEGEHSMSTLASATKGLTPFAVPCMTNEAIDAYNTTVLAIRQATSTTVADIKATKQKATCPPTMDGLILVLKRFGNLLMVLFTEDCPLFLVIEEIIDDMELYEPTAKLNFSRQSIATTLWIIHLQARHFAAGRMTGNTAILGEFINLQNAIKTYTPIVHGNVPTELIHPTGGIKKRDINDLEDLHVRGQEGGRSNKKARGTTGGQTGSTGERLQFIDRECYHPRIKAKLAPIFAKFPTNKPPKIRTMCTKAGTEQKKLFPARGDNFCYKAQIHGNCSSTCAFIHEKVSEEEATHVIKVLKKIIDNPNLLKVN